MMNISEPIIPKAVLTAPRATGVAGALVGLVLLGACSTDTGMATPAYVPPSAPSEKAIATAAKSLATDAKLTGPVEVSPVRPTDHGPGSYVVCLREANPPPDGHQRYYAMFFDNDTNKGARLSVIMDACEKQTFGPAPVVAPDAASGAPGAAKSKVRRGSTAAH